MSEIKMFWRDILHWIRVTFCIEDRYDVYGIILGMTIINLVLAFVAWLY